MSLHEARKNDNDKERWKRLGAGVSRLTKGLPVCLDGGESPSGRVGLRSRNKGGIH